MVNKNPDLLYRIMDCAIETNAADIHLKVGLPPSLRINSQIERVVNHPPLTKEDMDNLAFSLMPKKIEENFNKEADFSFQYKNSRFRINVGDENNGLFMTLRLIPDKIMEILEVGFPNNVWNEIITLPRGLVLVTGMTGSGKSTTLASIIQEINRNYKKSIITIEDPIEFIHGDIKSFVIQREVYSKTESFYSGVKWSLRQDPDVILVGEIRDSETAKEALRAAETGHLVFSTVHAKNSSGAISRFTDLFEPKEKDTMRRFLGDSLSYVLAQQLVPHTTEKRRVLAMEVMANNYAISQQIRDDKLNQIQNYMNKDNMITMDKRLEELYEEGEISKDTAIEFAIDRKAMAANLPKNN